MPINPDTLKKLRGDLSQEDLAEKAGVSRKTISQIENGHRDPDKIRIVTVKRLAKALSTTPEELAADPNKDSVSEASMRRWGYRKINTYLHGDTALSLALVEQRYGISAKRQLDMAPLFIALLAEMSLRDRRQKLEDLSNAFEEYSANLPVHISHGEVARSDFDNAYHDENRRIDVIAQEHLAGFEIVTEKGLDRFAEETNAELKRQITVARRMIRARIEAAVSGTLRGPWTHLTGHFEDLLARLPRRNETSETLQRLLAWFSDLQERVEAAYLKATQTVEVVENTPETNEQVPKEI